MIDYRYQTFLVLADSLNYAKVEEELAGFIKEMDLEGASLSDVFANLYLYYLTSGKVK